MERRVSRGDAEETDDEPRSSVSGGAEGVGRGSLPGEDSKTGGVAAGDVVAFGCVFDVFALRVDKIDGDTGWGGGDATGDGEVVVIGGWRRHRLRGIGKGRTRCRRWGVCRWCR